MEAGFTSGVVGSSSGDRDEIDHLLMVLLKEAQSRGLEPDDVLRRLEQMIRPRLYERILIVEPEPAMREILMAELREQLRIPVLSVAGIEPGNNQFCESLVVVLAPRARKVNQGLPPGTPCVPLRLRSVRGSLEGQERPEPASLVSIVSRSAEIREWARAMLIAVGLDPQCLCDLNADESGWPDRLALSALVVADVVAAREVPLGRPVKVFRVIADSSIAELKRFSAS